MTRRHQTTEAQADPLTEQALAWLVRLHSGEETDADWDAYHDWKAASHEQAEAARRAEHLWGRLGPALKPRHTARNAAGAVALLACLAGAAIATDTFGPVSGWLADEATGIGEQRVITLADGSSVAMDSATALDIEFSAGERRIVLRDGQVFVTVAPDAARPFVVEAERGTVRALGTAFNVRAGEDGVQVTVTEHAVHVTYGSAGGVDVQEGEAVAYAQADGLGTPGAVDTDSVTAWRRGEILFDNRALGDVANELGRYRRGAVLFTSGALKDLPVTGVFSTTDADTFFVALEQTLPVHVMRLPYVTVILRDPERALQSYQPRN